MDKDIATFDYLQLSPVNWGIVAQHLETAAYKLELEKNEQDDRFVHYSISDVYYMLIGFALENYYKGAISVDLALNKKQLSQGRLEFIFKTHNVLQLAKQAKVNIGEKLHESYLNHITEYVEWKGRYPIPTVANKINGAITYHPIKKGEKLYMVTSIQAAIPISAIHELLKSAEENLDKNIEYLRKSKKRI